MSSTEAVPTGFLVSEPLKITSDIESDLKFFAEDSPSTHLTASITFDLPQPFGPTTPTRLESRLIIVESTKDLKPDSFMEESLINDNQSNGLIYT